MNYGNWREEFKRKTVTAEVAAGMVSSGDRVYIPLAGPRVIHHAIARRRNELRDVQIHLARPGSVQVIDFASEAGWEASFAIEHDLFIGDENRWATDVKATIYNPVIFSLQFKPIDEGREEARPIDVLIVSVGPPNRQGFCNFGPELWHKRALAKRAKLVLAEVDDTLITAHGQTWIHVSEIDCFVETRVDLLGPADIAKVLADTPDTNREALRALIPRIDPVTLARLGPSLPQLPPDALALSLGLAEPDETTKIIARQVAELVRDGNCFQVGVGQPSASLIRLGVFDDRNDLGYQSEMASAGIAALVEKGIVNGRYKNIHTGKAVATSWSGCNAEDRAFIHDNPMFELYDSNYAVNARTFAQNDNHVAINNAISIDLMGQINAESAFGTRMINGSGGQPECHLGAMMSRGGRAITLCPSTRLGGALSSIVATFDPGTTVTIPRHWADTVVTEYGVARLLGKNHRQRAQALIGIAHPDFRDELTARAKELFYP